MSFEIRQEEKEGKAVNVIHIKTASYGAIIDRDPETNEFMTIERATEVAEKIVEIVLENERQAEIAETEKIKAEADQLAADEASVSEPEIMDDFWATPGV